VLSVNKNEIPIRWQHWQKDSIFLFVGCFWGGFCPGFFGGLFFFRFALRNQREKKKKVLKKFGTGSLSRKKK
jgi:hypothetical protein